MVTPMTSGASAASHANRTGSGRSGMSPIGSSTRSTTGSGKYGVR